MRSLASDCQEFESKAGEWLDFEFDNGSVSYDAQTQGNVISRPLLAFLREISELLADYDPDGEGLNIAISPSTAREYSRISSLIDPDESIDLGIYRPDNKTLEWRQITYRHSAAMKRELETPLPSYGAVQGILHAWFKEAKEPHFQLRELSTDAIVKVIYSATLYADVAKAVQERATVLIVSGDMYFDRATRTASELRADKIERVGMLSTAEFEGFFGNAPELCRRGYGDRWLIFVASILTRAASSTW